MKKIVENFNQFLSEDIYSPELRNFIRFSEKTKKIKDIEKRAEILFRYLKDDFKSVGCGVSRCAFKTHSGEFIKLVRFDEDVKFGIEHNKMEIEKFNRSDIEVFPRIEEVDEHGFWFVVEEVIPIVEDRKIKKGIIKKLFPVLDDMFSSFGDGTKMQLLRKMLMFKFKNKDEKWWDMSLQQLMSAFKFELMMTAMPNPEEEKQFYENLFNYMKKGDTNWRRLVYAINDANVAPNDLHYENLGYDENGVIKILDAGDIG